MSAATASRRRRRVPQRAPALGGARREPTRARRPRARAARARSRARSPRTRPTSRSCRSRPRRRSATCALVRGMADRRARHGAQRRRSSPSGRIDELDELALDLVVAHERRPRAARSSRARQARRRASSARLPRTRSRRVGGRTRRARHRRPRARASRDASRTRSISPRPGSSGRGCRSSSPRGSRGPGAVSRERRGHLPRREAEGPRARRRDRRRARGAHRASTPASLRAYLTRVDPLRPRRRGAPRPRALLRPRPRARASCRDATCASSTRPQRRAPRAVARHAPRARRRRRAPLAPPRASASLAKASLFDLGLAADAVRRRKHPHGVVTYIVDRNVNYTNVCTTSCRFCAFYRPVGHPEGYVLSREVLGQKLQEVVDAGGVQILLQGGLNPELRIEWYEDLFRWMKTRVQARPPRALAGGDPPHRAAREPQRRARCSSGSHAAGLDSVPGGGAEILVDRVRRKIAKAKCTSEEWLGVMRVAHQMGLRSSATMMYGTVDTRDDRIQHLVKIRDLQDETRRLHRVLLLGLPAREGHAPRSRATTARTSTCARRRSRASCSTTSITSAPRGSRRARTSGRSRCASAPTTSAA